MEADILGKTRRRRRRREGAKSGANICKRSWEKGGKTENFSYKPKCWRRREREREGRTGGPLLCPQFHFSPELGGFFWLPLAKRARGEEQTFGNFRLLAVFFDYEKKANRRNPRFTDAASQAVCMCTLPEEEK